MTGRAVCREFTPADATFLDKDGGPLPLSALFQRLKTSCPAVHETLILDVFKGSRRSLHFQDPLSRTDVPLTPAVEAWMAALLARMEGVESVELRCDAGDAAGALSRPMPDLSDTIAVMRFEMHRLADRMGLCRWRRAEMSLFPSLSPATWRRECFFSAAGDPFPSPPLETDSPLNRCCRDIEATLGLWLNADGRGRLTVSTVPASRHEMLDGLLAQCHP